MTDPTVDRSEQQQTQADDRPEQAGPAGDPAVDRLREVVEAPAGVTSPDEVGVLPDATASSSSASTAPASDLPVSDTPESEVPASLDEPVSVQPIVDQADGSTVGQQSVDAGPDTQDPQAVAAAVETKPDPVPHSIEGPPRKQRPRSRRPIVLASVLLLGVVGSLMTAKWQSDLPGPTPQDAPPIAADVLPGETSPQGGLLDLGEEILKAEIGDKLDNGDSQIDKPGEEVETVVEPDQDSDGTDQVEAPLTEDGVILDVAASWKSIETPDRATIEQWMQTEAEEAESRSAKIRPIGDMARGLITLDNPERDQYLDAVVRRMGFDPAYELWVTNPNTVDAAVEAVDYYTRAQTAIQAIQTAVQVHPGMEGQQDLHYMMAKAAIESDFVYRAPAAGSSGKGLFQFIDSTWLTQFYHHGAKYGYGDLSEQITLVGGKPVIEDAAVKQQILDLRSHPLVNALIAVDYTLGNDALMQRRLPEGHQIGHSERYLAHWLGPRGGVDFMNQYLERPSHAAADYFVSVSRVSGNRSMFYFRGGQKRSFAQVYDRAGSKITDAIEQLLSSQTAYLSAYENGDLPGFQQVEGDVVAELEVKDDHPPVPPRKPLGLGGPTG